MDNILTASGSPVGATVRLLAISTALLAFGTGQALAVPAFAEQTGQHCNICHVGGFGPQLTPFGRQFKLDGYVMRANSDGFNIPLSAMVMAGYVHTSANQPPPASHYALNDNTTLDQASIFIAGGIGDHFGGLAQITYDGLGHQVAWDNTDLRATDHVAIGGDDLLLGISLNNNPSVQDVWNTTPAWGFPFTSSQLQPGPGAGTTVNGGLAQAVLGSSVYAYWNSEIYAEAGAYWTPGRGFMKDMNNDVYAGGPVVDGAAPYFRVAYQKDYGDQNFELGAFGLFTNLETNLVPGPTDSYNDIGIDASYQFMGDGSDIYNINARYIHESQDLSGSYLMGASGQPHDTLDDMHVDFAYYWHNTLGGTIELFDIVGSRDAVLYAGNSTLQPNSSGLMLQVDGTPWGNEPSPFGERFNLRLGVQYIAYATFNGASSNWDGLGHNASDNNSFRVFAWMAL